MGKELTPQLIKKLEENANLMMSKGFSEADIQDMSAQFIEEFGVEKVVKKKEDTINSNNGFVTSSNSASQSKSQSQNKLASNQISPDFSLNLGFPIQKPVINLKSNEQEQRIMDAKKSKEQPAILDDYRTVLQKGIQGQNKMDATFQPLSKPIVEAQTKKEVQHLKEQQQATKLAKKETHQNINAVIPELAQAKNTDEAISTILKSDMKDNIDMWQQFDDNTLLSNDETTLNDFLVKKGLKNADREAYLKGQSESNPKYQYEYERNNISSLFGAVAQRAKDYEDVLKNKFGDNYLQQANAGNENILNDTEFNTFISLKEKEKSLSTKANSLINDPRFSSIKKELDKNEDKQLKSDAIAKADKWYNPTDELRYVGSKVLYAAGKAVKMLAELPSLATSIDKGYDWTDKLADWGDRFSTDLIDAIPVSTDLKAGFNNKVAKVGNYKVIIDDNGEVADVRDNNNFKVSLDEMKSVTDKYNANPKGYKVNNEYNPRSLADNGLNTVIDMGLMILGTKGAGMLGAGEKMQKLTSMGIAYQQTKRDVFNDALKKGLDPKNADLLSNIIAVAAGASSSINPLEFNIASGKGLFNFTKTDGLNAGKLALIKEGKLSAKDYAKEFVKAGIKNTIGENIEELVIEGGTQAIANNYFNSKISATDKTDGGLDDKLHIFDKQGLETFLITAGTSLLMTPIEMKSQMLGNQQEALKLAIDNPIDFKKIRQIQVEKGQLTQDEVDKEAKIYEDVSRTYNASKEEIKEELRPQLLALLTKKYNLSNKIGEIKDDVLSAPYKAQLEEINKGIQEIVNGNKPSEVLVESVETPKVEDEVPVAENATAVNIRTEDTTGFPENTTETVVDKVTENPVPVIEETKDVAAETPAAEMDNTQLNETFETQIANPATSTQDDLEPLLNKFKKRNEQIQATPTESIESGQEQNDGSGVSKTQQNNQGVQQKLGLGQDNNQEVPTEKVEEGIGGTESIKNRSRKDLFPDESEFSDVIGGSGKNSKISSYKEVNGIGISEYKNPDSGVVDVIMTGTSDNDYVGYVRIYENGKPTERWTSKMENKSGNKANFKTMISEVKNLLPANHEYTESTNISLDGIRVYANNLTRGYEILTDKDGNPVTNNVELNGATLEGLKSAKSDREISKLYNKRTGITREEFNSIKERVNELLPNTRLLFNEANGSVIIKLPVLKYKGSNTKSNDTPPTNAVNQPEQQDNGDSTGVAGSEQNGEAIRAKSEQGKLSNQVEVPQVEQEKINPALKDVDATAKALEGVDISNIKETDTNTYQLPIPNNINEAKKSAEDLLKKAGFKYDYSGQSDSNGLSVYFYVDGVKVRFSDHSISNKDRMANEATFYFGNDSDQLKQGILDIKQKRGDKNIEYGQFRTIKRKSDGKELKAFGLRENITPQSLSEAYHKAKADGSNPELVKAVEDLLGKAPTQYTEASTPKDDSAIQSGGEQKLPDQKEVPIEQKQEVSDEKLSRLPKKKKDANIETPKPVDEPIQQAIDNTKEQGVKDEEKSLSTKKEEINSKKSIEVDRNVDRVDNNQENIETSSSKKLKTNGNIIEGYNSIFGEDIVDNKGNVVGSKISDTRPNGKKYYQTLTDDTPENRKGFGWQEHQDIDGKIFKKFETLDDLEKFIDSKKQQETPNAEVAVADVDSEDLDYKLANNKTQVPEGKGSWRKTFNNTKDAMRKKDILRSIADISTDVNELKDITEATKGLPEGLQPEINYAVEHKLKSIINKEALDTKPTPKAETTEVRFTESKDMNKMYADLKSKHGDKKGAAIYEAANRLVNPNTNTIVEIRSNGVVVKEGDRYIMKPFGNTDANSNKWTLYKGIDVTDQFVEQKPASKTETPEKTAEISPNKNVSASKASAIKDLLADKYSDLKEMEAGILANLDGTESIDDLMEYVDWNRTTQKGGVYKGKGLKGSNIVKLIEKGYVEELSFMDENITLTDKGKKFQEALKARQETRKGIKEGTDLFPKDAGLSGKDLVEDAIDRIANKIGSKKNLTEQERTSLTKDITDLAKGLIQMGKATIDNVIDKIKEEIKKRFPELDDKTVNEISENIEQKVILDAFVEKAKEKGLTYEQTKERLDKADADYNEQDLKDAFEVKKETKGKTTDKHKKELDDTKQRVANRFVLGDSKFNEVRQLVIENGYDKGDYDSEQIFKDVDNLIKQVGEENIEQLLEMPLSEPHRVVLQHRLFEHFGKISTDESLPEQVRKEAFQKSARYLLEYSRQRTDSGRANAILHQIYLDSDIYFTLPMMQEKMKALGTVLSDTEMAEITEMAKEIEQLRKENKELQELAKKEQEQQTIDDITNHLLVDELIIDSKLKDEIDVKNAKQRLGKNFQKIAERFGAIRMLEATEKSDFFEILHEMTKDLMTISKIGAKKAVKSVIKSIKQQHSNIDDNLLKEAQQYVLGQEKEETDIEDKNGNKISKGDLLELIEGGADTMDKLVEAIREKFHDGNKSITDKQIRDSITNYGNSTKKDRTDVEKKLSEIKALMLIQSKLEDALNNVHPKKTGVIREKDTIEVIQLRRQLAEAMKKLTGDMSENEIAGLNERKLTYLNNRIKEVEDVLKGITKDINKKAPFEYSQAVKDKQKELDDLMKQQDVLLHYTKEKLTNLAAKYQEKIDKKIYSKNPVLNKLSITDAEHQKLKKSLEDKKEQLKKDRDNFRNNDSDYLMQQMQKSVDRQIARIDELLAGIDKRKTSEQIKAERLRKQGIIDKNSNTTALQALKDNQKSLEDKKEKWEKIVIKKQIDAELAEQSKLRRMAGVVINNLISLSRTATLGLIDVGWLGVQGGYFMRTHPIMFANALKTAYTNKDLDEKSFNEWRKDLKNLDRYELMLKSGLRIPSQSLREEVFEQEYRQSMFTDFLDKIPGARIVNKNGRLSVKFLAHLRMDMFNNMYNKLTDEQKQDTKTLEKLADFINVHSGAGGIIGENKNGNLHKAWGIMTSARNTSSMLQQTYLGKIYNLFKNYDHKRPLRLNPLKLSEDQPIVAQQIINEFKNQAVLFGTLFIAQAIARGLDDDDEKTGDWNIEYNPFSTDFLKLKGNGKEYFDMGGTTSLNVATLRLASMMLNMLPGFDIKNYKTDNGEGQVGGSSWYDQKGIDILAQAVTNRIVPLLSFIKNPLLAKKTKEENYKLFGEEYTPKEFAGKTLLDMFLPINAMGAWKDAKKIYTEKDDKLQNGVMTGVNFFINAFGVGVGQDNTGTGKGKSNSQTGNRRTERDNTARTTNRRTER